MRIEGFRLTRFQYARDRVIGDSQVGIAFAHYCRARTPVGHRRNRARIRHRACSTRCRRLQEIERIFREEAWPGLEGQPPAGLVHRITRPRGGNARRMSPAVRGSHQPGLLGSRGQAGRPAALPAPRRHARMGAHLRQRPRFPPHRQRIRRVLQRGRGAGLSRLQDQGRPPRRGVGPAPAEACCATRSADAGPIMVDCQRGVVATRGDPPARHLPARGVRHPVGRGPLHPRRFRGPARDPGGRALGACQLRRVSGPARQAAADRGARRRHPQRARQRLATSCGRAGSRPSTASRSASATPCSRSACIWPRRCPRSTGSNIRSRTTITWSSSRSRCATATPSRPSGPAMVLC